MSVCLPEFSFTGELGVGVVTEGVGMVAVVTDSVVVSGTVAVGVMQEGSSTSTAVRRTDST